MNEPLTYEETCNLSTVPYKKGLDYIVAGKDNKELIEGMQNCIHIIEQAGLTIRDFEMVCLPKSEFDEDYRDHGLRGYAYFRRRIGGYLAQKSDTVAEDCLRSQIGNRS